MSLAFAAGISVVVAIAFVFAQAIRQGMQNTVEHEEQGLIGDDGLRVEE